MKTYAVVLNDQHTRIRAEYFNQANDYVSFYIKPPSGVATCVALIRMGSGDTIVEENAPGSKAPLEHCPDCGYRPGERGNVTKTQA